MKKMPTYDYRCNKCGIVREVFRQLGEDSEPICCEMSMERVWSAPPVHFKGNGFYTTGG